LTSLRAHLRAVEGADIGRLGLVSRAELDELKSLVAAAEHYAQAGEPQLCGELVGEALQWLGSIREPQLAKLDDVLGQRVRTAEGDDIGRIRQIVVDPVSGRVAYALIAIGGWWGIGEDLIVVPWGALRRDPTADRIVVPISAARLSHAPRHDDRKWSAMADRSWGLAVHKFFDVQPYWQRSGGVASIRLTTQERRSSEALAQVPGRSIPADDAAAPRASDSVDRLSTGLDRLEQRLDSLSDQVQQLQSTGAATAAPEGSGRR
jgi:sporulation protein YlmC with PRC-barrel domain